MHNVTGLPSTDVAGISPRMSGARAALVATVGADDVVAAAEAVLAGSPGMAVAAASPVHVYDRRGGKAVEVRAARR